MKSLLVASSNSRLTGLRSVGVEPCERIVRAGKLDGLALSINTKHQNETRAVN